MPFDGIVAHAIALELNDKLQGGRIGKIQQPNRETVIIPVRAGGENYKLLASRSGSNARIHLTADDSAENPASPPMFCMLLRKHLGGGIIRSVTCPEFERIVVVEVETEDELGDRSIKKLVVEVMGRHSNIILLNRDDIILDAARHVDVEMSRVREVLPAHPYYSPPAQNKMNLMLPQTPAKALFEITASSKKLAAVVLDQIRGFSPILCRELCHRAAVDADKAADTLEDDEKTRLLHTLTDLHKRLIQSQFQPCNVIDLSTKQVADFHAWQLSVIGSLEAAETISAALDLFFSERDAKAKLSGKRAELSKVVQQNVNHVQRRLNTQLDTLAVNADFGKLQKYGELITANIYHLDEGITEATVVDYYTEDGQTVIIPMEVNLSPQRNAQRYFKKYQKAKSACRYAESQLDGLKSELDYLESLLFAIENAESVKDFQEIRDEMISGDYLKAPVRRLGKGGRPKPKSSSGNPAPAEPLVVQSIDGFDIFIGRNNRQNDRLTLKMARSEDLWFHIKHFSGSHVVVRTDGKTVPPTTIEEAAGYAAWHSKAKQSAKAEVDFTQIRNVKKPSGGKPGMVIYVNYETILAEPKQPQV